MERIGFMFFSVRKFSSSFFLSFSPPSAFLYKVMESAAAI